MAKGNSHGKFIWKPNDRTTGCHVPWVSDNVTYHLSPDTTYTSEHIPP